MGRMLFVTGTDTGVGKTVTSAVLAREAREEGLHVAYCKPIQTGLTSGEPGDASFVQEFSKVDVYELLRFRDPLAPLVAAAREEVKIDVRQLVIEIRDLAGRYDLLIVEGAGGLLVPISSEVTMAELARDLNAPLVLVARPGLGTLNHIALSAEAARTRGLEIDQLVLADWPDSPTLAEVTNRDRLGLEFDRVRLIPHDESIE
ncbi:MAG: dethiobiotin synthase [Actinomycetota bacterium]